MALQQNYSVLSVAVKQRKTPSLPLKIQPYFPDNYTTKSQPFAVIIPQSEDLVGKHQSIVPEH